MSDWLEKEIDISFVKTLIEDNYEIEVDSPDGWVSVIDFVDKGNWEEYVLEVENYSTISCNENHLFETDIGWLSAKELSEKKEFMVLTKNEYKRAKVIKTGNIVPIVDITVDHENHRYYTDKISSHNTGVGKSLAMCHIAASFMVQGYNVLYITLEMAEERIAERIDANLLNVSLDDLLKLPKDMYDKKIERVRKNTTGKLKIKEYPTASAGSIHFRNLLNELALKKSFRPDVIFVDYLNICSSSRIKAGSNVNSYTYIKAIAEELRGLAVEFKVPLISATQTTRSGYSSTDVELTDTSECIWVEEKVTMIDGSIKTMEEIVPGDQIIANDGYKTTLFVHHKKPKDCVKVTLKSGKSIIVSKDHVFPTSSGRKSVNDGLKIGDILHSL